MLLDSLEEFAQQFMDETERVPHVSLAFPDHNKRINGLSLMDLINIISMTNSS